MKRLGICDSHDASVVVSANNSIVCAVLEERFTRRKKQQGFPFQSLSYIKEQCGAEFETVSVSTRSGRGLFRLLNAYYSDSPSLKNILSFFSRCAYFWENMVASLPVVCILDYWLSRLVIIRYLAKAGIVYHSLCFVDHHDAHIISALQGIESSHYIAASFDAYGDGLSARIKHVVDHALKDERRISYQHSIALVYGYVTAYLGFGEGDEGKVMALADHGVDTSCLKLMRSLFKVINGCLIISPYYKTRQFKKRLYTFRKEDCAYALQRGVEEVVLELLSYGIDRSKSEKPDIFLAGGLFTNVKINQKLHECGLFHRIFINPCMNDGGTAFCGVGNCAQQSLIKTMKLGPSYSDEDIRDILDAYNLSYTYCDKIEMHVAELLAQGHVVARFQGRMEFGPRALGNRSILYQTGDPTVQQWLNKKLGRDVFMPFAPITLKEQCGKNYLFTKNAEYATAYMTISLPCTSAMREQSPNVVHIDGTARVQLVDERDDVSLHSLLHEYYIRTGIPSLLNTSFNMHGEPIVCTPHDAIRTFQSASLDVLAIGSYLIKK